MPEYQTEYTWGVLGQTVRGAAHERSGLPNQDSIHWYPKSPGRHGPPLVVVISDGHGSAKCFRSDIGSIIATHRIRRTIQLLLKSDLMNSDLTTIKRLLDEKLPHDIVRNWKDAVERDLKDHPFSEEELARLESKEGPLAREKVQKRPVIAYGATLLVVMVSANFIHILQLGDGDILTVSDAGEVSRPLPKDERLIANETTSLSQEKAWQDCRSVFIPLAGSPPALIFLSSDGYSNSFRDEESFLKAASDFLELIRTEGPQFVRCSMGDWLIESSSSGSGDDISVGIIFREDILDTYKTSPVAEHDPDEIFVNNDEVDSCSSDLL